MRVLLLLFCLAVPSYGQAVTFDRLSGAAPAVHTHSYNDLTDRPVIAQTLQTVMSDVTVSGVDTEEVLMTVPVTVAQLTAGRTFIGKYMGVYSSSSATPQVTMRLKLGTNPATATVLGSASAQLPAGVATNQLFEATTFSTIRVAGAAGSIMSLGKLEYNTAAGNLLAALVNLAPTSVNLSANTNLYATVRFNAASGQNIIRLMTATMRIE